ncbi:hypothetical protein Tco_0724781 [Tanacetum coccineum]|uniref:Tf2-1-like SH3-like domain-containing protein n=1 Tax=Tanacetum coccineum TaxID=301880 RepID=A0ABQ4YBW8_9ASTR
MRQNHTRTLYGWLSSAEKKGVAAAHRSEWWWGSGRSGDGEHFWFRLENSPEKFSGGGKRRRWPENWPERWQWCGGGVEAMMVMITLRCDDADGGGVGVVAGVAESVEVMERPCTIKDRLKATRDRQKSYVDKRRKPLEFSVGEYVLLKVSPWKGVVRFGKMGKLTPRFVGPFEIIERIGPVTYRLYLPEEVNGVHDTFHVSNLKKCLGDPTLQVPLDEIRVDAKLNFVEEPMEILEREFKKLKRSRIAIVKVRWNWKGGLEFTWEREDQMRLKYPQLFSSNSR